MEGAEHRNVEGAAFVNRDPVGAGVVPAGDVTSRMWRKQQHPVI